MTTTHNEERDLAVDRMATAIAAYIERRYPSDNSLITLQRHLRGDEQALARALLQYRWASKWPDAEVLSEVRCVSCLAPLSGEPSAREDEDVCEACAEFEAPPDSVAAVSFSQGAK